jgi:predicted MFS family arabinose efflux permease
MVCAPIAGRLSDKVEPRIVSSTGMGLSALCLFALSFLTEATPLPFIVATLAFLFYGFGVALSHLRGAASGAPARKA